MTVLTAFLVKTVHVYVCLCIYIYIYIKSKMQHAHKSLFVLYCMCGPGGNVVFFVVFA